MYDLRACLLVFSGTIICCNYFYISVKWPLTCLLSRIKAHFAWGQANLKCKGIWWGEKWSVFRGSFKSESEFIWSNIALNRSFCDFRCLESEFWKRGYFGRFWKIKWRKRQSTKNPSWKYKVTASRVCSWRRQTWRIIYRSWWRRQKDRWRRQSGHDLFTEGGDGVT